MTKTLSQSEYFEAKKLAMQNEPVSMQVSIHDVDIAKDSISGGYIGVSGKRISVENGFFSDLYKMLKIGKSLIRDIQHSDNEMGTQFTALIISALKELKHSAKPMQITLIANPSTKNIIGTKKSDYSRISNGSMFTIVEDILDRNAGIGVSSLYHEGNGMIAGVKLISLADIGFDAFDNDERFNFGAYIENRGSDTVLGDFSYRLVCENGMMGVSEDEVFKMKGLTSSDVSEMLKKLHSMELRKFVPIDFEAWIRAFVKTPASLKELEETMKSTFDLIRYDADNEHNDMYESCVYKQFFTEIEEAHQRLLNKGFDPDKMTKKQKSYIRTKKNMWQLINDVTFIGSHDIGVPMDMNAMQRLGGKLFAKENDLIHAELLNI